MTKNDGKVTTGLPDRRRFLVRTLAGAAAGLAAQAGIELIVPKAARAQTELSPEAALQELMAGNRRFVTGRLASASQDLKALKERTAKKQEPFAAVLACADSRVPVELVFDQTIGQLFVARVAGNIVTPEIIASLEYGVAVLGVKALLVLGHTDCGALKAAMTSETVPGQISSLYKDLRPAVEKSGGSWRRRSKQTPRDRRTCCGHPRR